MLCLAVPAPLFAGEANVRNVSREESHADDALRDAGTAALYLPARLTDISLLGVEKTAAYLSDPDFIDKVEDILYLYKRDLLWFPVVEFSSGFRPSYGGGLYYKHEGIKALFKGSVHDANYWSLKLSTSYTHAFDFGIWKTSVSGSLEKKDDRRYYGLGPDPDNDERNTFITHTGQDYGVFTEDKRKLQFKTSFEPTEDWGFQYLGYYQRRGFEDEGKGGNPLRDIFDLTSIPGFTKDSPVAQIYNEVSVFVDTRDNKKLLSPGFRAGAYGGVSSGVGQNESDFYRAGFDLAGFIPTFAEDRLIVPSVYVDLVEDINDKPIPFTEYPRHHQFRGISTKALIHNDELSVAPSLEYQWPLSHMLIAGVFFDYVAVGESLADLDLNDGIWASGGSLKLHLFDREIGKAVLSGGSEGFRAFLSVGVPFELNERGDW